MDKIQHKIIFGLIFLVLCENFSSCEKLNTKIKKKDIRDYTDAEIEAIYDEWEVLFISLKTFQPHLCYCNNRISNKNK